MLSQASRSSVTIWEETAPVKLTRRHCPPSGSQSGVRILISEEWCFTLRLHGNQGSRFEVSHLRYASLTRTQYELTVKVHRVFPSYCGQAASSPPLQFRRDPLRDSRSVVTRFVQVGTYPTRNFAHVVSGSFKPAWTISLSSRCRMASRLHVFMPLAIEAILLMPSRAKCSRLCIKRRTSRNFRKSICFLVLSGCRSKKLTISRRFSSFRTRSSQRS